MNRGSGDRLRIRARVRDAVRRILAEHATPSRLAMSVALGVFVACTPFYGLQTVLALGLAWALRLNRVAAILAAQVSIAPVSPFLIFASVELGELVLHGHFFAIDMQVLRTSSWAEIGGMFFFAWLLGGCLIGALLGALFGAATFVVAKARGRTPLDGGARAALQRAASRYRTVPPRIRLYTRIKYFVDPGYLRVAEAVAALDPAQRRTIVDLGCGVGMLSVLLAEMRLDGDVCGVDWDRSKLSWARAASRDLARLEFRSLDLLADPLPEADCAVLLDVLHYHPVATQDSLLGRAAAALSSSGVLLVREADADHHFSVARWFERFAVRLRWHRAAGRFHYRSSGSLVAALERLGFAVSIEAAGDLVHRANLLLVARRTARPGSRGSPAPAAVPPSTA